MIKKICLLSFFSLFLAISVVGAQEINLREQRMDSTQEMLELMQINEEDLEIGKQSVLPGDAFYGFKEFGRGLSLFFTLDPIRRAQRHSDFANERLLEIQTLANQDADPGVLENALAEYQTEIAQLQERIESATGEELTQEEQDRLRAFLEKFSDHQIRHQEVLERVGERVPEQAKERIAQVRQNQAQRFIDTLDRVDPDGQQQFLQRGVQRQLEREGEDELQHLERMRILQKIGREHPNAQARVGAAQAEVFQRLENKLDQSDTPMVRTRIQNYIDHVSGDQVEAIDFISGLKRASSNRHKRIFQEIEQNEIEKLEAEVLQDTPRAKRLLEKQENREYIQQLPIRMEVKERASSLRQGVPIQKQTQGAPATGQQVEPSNPGQVRPQQRIQRVPQREPLQIRP